MAEREYQGGQVSRIDPGFTRPGVGGVRSGIPQISPTGPRQPLVEAQAVPQPLDVRGIEQALGNWVQIQTRRNQERRADEAAQLALQRQAELGNSAIAGTPENYTNAQKNIFEKHAREVYLQASQNDTLEIITTLSQQHADDPDGFTLAATEWLDAKLEGMEEQDIRLYTAVRTFAEASIAQRSATISEQAFKKEQANIRQAALVQYAETSNLAQRDVLQNPTEGVFADNYALLSQNAAIIAQEQNLSPFEAYELEAGALDGLLTTYATAKAQRYQQAGNFAALRGLGMRMQQGRFSAAGITFIDPLPAADTGTTLVRDADRMEASYIKEATAAAKADAARLRAEELEWINVRAQFIGSLEEDVRILSNQDPTVSGDDIKTSAAFTQLEELDPRAASVVLAHHIARRFAGNANSAPTEDIEAKIGVINQQERDRVLSPQFGGEIREGLQKILIDRQRMADAPGIEQVDYCYKNRMGRQECATALEVPIETLNRYAPTLVEELLTGSPSGDVTYQTVQNALRSSNDSNVHFLDFMLAVRSSGLDQEQQAIAVTSAVFLGNGALALAEEVTTYSAAGRMQTAEVPSDINDLLDRAGINQEELHDAILMLSGHDPGTAAMMASGVYRYLQGAESMGTRGQMIDTLRQLDQVEVAGKPYLVSFFQKPDETPEMTTLRVRDFDQRVQERLTELGLDGRDAYVVPAGGDNVQVIVGSEVVSTPEGAQEWDIIDYTSIAAENYIGMVDEEMAIRARTQEVLEAELPNDPIFENQAQNAATLDAITKAADDARIDREPMIRLLIADRIAGQDVNGLEAHIAAASERLDPPSRGPAGRGGRLRGDPSIAPPSLMFSNATNHTYDDYAKFYKNVFERLGDPEQVFAARIMGADWVQDAVARMGGRWTMALPEEVADYVASAMGAKVDELNLPRRTRSGNYIGETSAAENLREAAEQGLLSP